MIKRKMFFGNATSKVIYPTNAPMLYRAVPVVVSSSVAILPVGVLRIAATESLFCLSIHVTLRCLGSKTCITLHTSTIQTLPCPCGKPIPFHQRS